MEMLSRCVLVERLCRGNAVGGKQTKKGGAVEDFCRPGRKKAGNDKVCVVHEQVKVLSDPPHSAFSAARPIHGKF